MVLCDGVVPIPSSGPPPLPPIRWGLWEGRVEGMPGMDEPSVTRSCVSAATWKGFMDSHGDDSQQCVWSNQRATAKTYNADMSCAAGKITGHGELTIDSPESFHYKMSIDVAQDPAHPKHFEVTATSKFLSTSCYGLRPGEDIDVWE
ncbi:MAG TPA: DUF3617 family protein [Edaphobacter sp.]|nr:DUF3617 family protein [Edaphobacter sp.]